MTMFIVLGMKKGAKCVGPQELPARKENHSAPVINDVFRDVREVYIPTDIEVLGTVLDSLQINQFIAYRGLSPEKISRSLNSIKFQKTKKAVVALPRDIRLLIKKNGYELAETRSKIAWRVLCLQHLVYSLGKLIILLTQRVFKKQRLPERQYIYLYNFPAESAESIIKVVIGEGRNCGPSKAQTVVLGGPNINKESKPLPYNAFAF